MMISETPTTSGTVRVLLVDDHRIVREGLRSYLRMIPDIEVVGEASNGQEAVDAVDGLVTRNEPPDVVLMDLVMPRMDGIHAISTIRERHPDVEVVAMTSFSEAERVRTALRVGAAGYLLKDASADDVAAAIRDAHQGKVHLDPTVAASLTNDLRAPRLNRPELTHREREVLHLVAEGLANRQIADRLVISERTARTHVSNILLKLGLGSRTQAVLWAIREGLVPPPSTKTSAT